MITKKPLVVAILGSLLFMIGLTQPWLVTWSSYDMTWSWVMGISGLVGMVIITRQVLLGIRVGGWLKKIDTAWLNKLHGYLGLGTIMALIFHPLAVMIAYGTSFFYLFDLNFASIREGWISLGKISFDLMIVVGIIYLVSRKLLLYTGNTWLHLLLYPIFIALWGHAWFSGSMIAELPGVRWYWIFLGAVLMVATVIKLAYEMKYRIHKEVQQETTIIHFSPLFS